MGTRLPTQWPWYRLAVCCQIGSTGLIIALTQSSWSQTQPDSTAARVCCVGGSLLRFAGLESVSPGSCFIHSDVRAERLSNSIIRAACCDLQPSKLQAGLNLLQFNLETIRWFENEPTVAKGSEVSLVNVKLCFGTCCAHTHADRTVADWIISYVSVRVVVML